MNMLMVITVLLLAVSIGAMIVLPYMLIRNEWTYKNTIKYINALDNYLTLEQSDLDLIQVNEYYKKLTPYQDVMNDWFNWSQEQFITDSELFNKLQKYVPDMNVGNIEEEIK